MIKNQNNNMKDKLITVIDGLITIIVYSFCIDDFSTLFINYCFEENPISFDPFEQ